MRKTWPVIAVSLLCVAPLAAQQPRKASNQPAGQWAVAQAAPAAQAPTTYVLLAGNAGGRTAVAQVQAVVAVPVVAQPLPPAPPAHPPEHDCAGGHCAQRHECDWQHFRDWLCYRGVVGCCNKKTCCGGCHYPLYTYFLYDCKEGRKYELPCCAREYEPRLFAGMMKDGKAMIRSCGNTACPCTTAGCCATHTEPAVTYGAAQQAAVKGH